MDKRIKYMSSPPYANMARPCSIMSTIGWELTPNKMFNIMRQFGDGDITTVQAIHSLAASGLGKQFVLKTSKAISHLTQVERLFLSSSERKAISTLMEDRGREIDTKLKLSKREFRGKGQYIDELFK